MGLSWYQQSAVLISTRADSDEDWEENNTLLLFTLCRDAAHNLLQDESQGCFPGDKDPLAKIEHREATPS